MGTLLGIPSPEHPSHTEICKYIFLIDFGTLNRNLGAFSFVTPSEIVRHLGNTWIDSNILR